MRLLAILSLLIAAPAWADDECHDLWFTRNLIMDRAGYCFGSTLGRAVFGAGDCTGKTVQLDSADARLVKQIQRLEKDLGCAVNTRSRRLDLDNLPIRRKLVDLPVRDQFESACLGWLGSDTPLHAGHDRSMPVLGQISRGDYVLYGYVNVGDWVYVTVANARWVPRSGGWFDTRGQDARCRNYAG